MYIESGFKVARESVSIEVARESVSIKVARQSVSVKLERNNVSIIIDRDVSIVCFVPAPRLFVRSGLGRPEAVVHKNIYLLNIKPRLLFLF